MPSKLNLNEFIFKSEKIHGDKYDYSLVDYKNIMTKVKILCKKHGIFEQVPLNHINGHGCLKCSKDKRYDKNIKCLEFIKKANDRFENKYDYSLVEYKNRSSKVKIICPEHGKFESTPINHLNRSGCPKCSEVNIRQKNKKLFIEKSNLIHNCIYDYSLVNYISDKTKVKIICKLHGVFDQQPNTHVNGVGCPKCSSSKGEVKIFNYLTENSVKFESQKKFENCLNIKELQFDFYLPDYKICLEFDGRQHYQPIEFFGGNLYHEKITFRDNIKNQYCIDNNIRLIRIPYYEFERIYEILDNIWVV